jgi:hypothetical protein
LTGLNGRYTCQGPDLLDIPRTKWGWAGLTVPDFMFAVRDPRAALEAGLDLPALGSDSQLTQEDLLANEARARFHRAACADSGRVCGTKTNAELLRSRRGKAVPQLYVAFPPEVVEPPAQLRALQVVRLDIGQVSEVRMEIPIDDLAIYDDQYGSRVVRAGTYEIHLGVSSADLRLKAAVQVS